MFSNKSAIFAGSLLSSKSAIFAVFDILVGVGWLEPAIFAGLLVLRESAKLQVPDNALYHQKFI